jgi:hypothetical protein
MVSREKPSRKQWKRLSRFWSKNKGQSESQHGVEAMTDVIYDCCRGEATRVPAMLSTRVRKPFLSALLRHVNVSHIVMKHDYTVETCRFGNRHPMHGAGETRKERALKKWCERG